MWNQNHNGKEVMAMEIEIYLTPKMEIIQFETEDVISTSGDDTDLDLFVN